MWTKGEIVADAYNELAIAGWVYDLDEGELQWAGQRLDALMAQWDMQGLRLGYALSSSPSALDLDVSSGIPLGSVRAVVLNLAKSLAAGKGKQLPAQTLSEAKSGLDLLKGRASFPPRQQFPNTLQRGQGSKPWRTVNRPYMPTPDTNSLQVGADGGLDFTE